MCRLIACIVADIGCRMETLTNKGVTCFQHRSNKYRRYYVKRKKMFAGVVVEEFGFHCHFEKVLNTSATVLRTACKKKSWAESYHRHLNADFNGPHPNIYIFVEALLRQQAATYVAVSSLSKSPTVQRYIREKSVCLCKLFTDYSAGLQIRLDYLKRVCYQFAPSP